MPAKEQRTTVGTPAGYDQSAVASLIAQAPEITKADRQVRVRESEVAPSQVSAGTWPKSFCNRR